MRRTYQPGVTPPLPAFTSTSCSLPQDLSSTRALQSREARDVDDLLQSQRQRLEDKDREMRQLRRTVQQLSAREVEKPRKKHPLLDKKKGNKTTAAKPKPRAQSEKSKPATLNVKVVSAPPSPRPDEAAVDDDEVGDAKVVRDAPLLEVMSSRLQQRLLSSNPDARRSPVPSSSPTGVAPPSPSSLSSAQSQLEQLRASLAAEKQRRKKAEDDVQRLTVQREEMEERIRKVRDGEWQGDLEERQALKDAIAQREMLDRDGDQQRQTREAKTEEIRSALREAIAHLQEKNALIEQLTEQLDALKEQVAAMTGDGQLSVDEVQDAVRSHLSSRPPSPKDDSEQRADHAADVAALQASVEALQGQVEQLAAELEDRESIIAEQRRKLKKAEREASRRDSQSNLSPQPQLQPAPSASPPPAPSPPHPQLSGTLRVTATLNPAFFLFASSSSASAVVTFLSISPSSSSSTATSSTPQTGLTPRYDFSPHVTIPLPSAAQLSLHLQSSTNPAPLLLATHSLPFPFHPSSTQLTWQGQGAERMTDAQRLIGIIQWKLAAEDQRREEEQKEQLVDDQYAGRTEAARGSGVKRAGGTADKCEVTVVIHSCSLLRQSRLLLHAQCPALGLSSPLTPLPSQSASSSLHFPIPLPCPLPSSDDLSSSALRLSLLDSKHGNAVVGLFELPLTSLSPATHGANGEKKAEWVAVLHPRSEQPIGSVELGLQWSVA